MEKGPAIPTKTFTSENYAFGLSQKPGDFEMFFLDRKPNSQSGAGMRFAPGFKMSTEVGREIFQRPRIEVHTKRGYIADIKILKSK